MEHPKTTLMFVPATEKDDTRTFFELLDLPKYDAPVKAGYYRDDILERLGNLITSGEPLAVGYVQERSGHADWSFYFYGVPESLRVMRNSPNLEIYFRGGESLRISLTDTK